LLLMLGRGVSPLPLESRKLGVALLRAMSYKPQAILPPHTTQHALSTHRADTQVRPYAG